MILKHFYLLFILMVINQDTVSANKRSVDSKDSLNRSKDCQEITIPFCKSSLPYNSTLKLIKHGRRIDQIQILNELSRYERLYKFNCSTYLGALICSYHLPICAIRTLLPCKELCAQVKKECQPVLNRHNFDWPDELDCKRLPTYEKTQKCFTLKELHFDSSYQPLTTSSPNSSYQNLTTVNALTEKQPLTNLTCPLEFKKPTNSRFVFRIANFETKNCSYPCHDFIYDKSTSDQARILICIFAAISLAINLILQATYLIDRNRFRYPIKAIIQISFCYMIISIIYLVGYKIGDSIACDLEMSSDPKLIIKLLSIDEKFTCKFVFMLVNFFATSSLLWFIVLIISFYLQIVLMWATEVIENKNLHFHLIVILLSSLHTAITGFNAELQGDSLSGLCTISSNQQLLYLIIPQIVLLTFGLLVFMIAIFYFFKIKQFLSKMNNDSMKDFESFVFKLLVFLLLYLIAYMAQFLVFYFEFHSYDLWVQQWYRSICEKDLSKCSEWVSKIKPMQNVKATILFVSLKYLSNFLPCIAICSLLFYRKTLKTWSNFSKRFLRLFNKVF